MVVHFETFFLSEISVTKDGNECSCDNVVTRQQHYFCRFLAQSFRGQWRFKRLYNNGQDIPRRCLFSSSSSTFDKSTSADPILPKNAGLLLIGSFLCPKAGKTNKSRHSMLASQFSARLLSCPENYQGNKNLNSQLCNNQNVS